MKDQEETENMEEPRIDKTIYTGRPENTEGRLEKEIAVYDFLDSLGIEYKRVDHEARKWIIFWKRKYAKICFCATVRKRIFIFC